MRMTFPHIPATNQYLHYLGKSMPDGNTHYAAFKRGYILSVPVAFVCGVSDVRLGIGYILGYSFGRFCDPDWDLMSANSAEGRMVNDIPILGHILFGISSSYGSFWRRHHRSFWTHFPVVSTLIRLIWVFIIPFAIMDGYGVNLMVNGWHRFWLGFWAGLSHADAIHFYLDKFYGGE